MRQIGQHAAPRPIHSQSKRVAHAMQPHMAVCDTAISFQYQSGGQLMTFIVHRACHLNQAPEWKTGPAAVYSELYDHRMLCQDMPVNDYRDLMM